MKVLVIGTGGREHALARALSTDPAVTALYCAPGNPGIAEVAELRAVDPLDPAAVRDLAVELGADLVVVGPEAPLVAGVADPVREAGIPVFGPSKAAALLEGSKAFSKEVMAAAGIPTAKSYVCETDAEYAKALDEFAGFPYVVKDDALAAGKGVVVTEDRAAALEHARACGRVVIEEYLDGPEVSLFGITDGTAVVPMMPSQDFKRIGDGDTGLNTGGMGSYCPLPWTPEGLTDEVVATVIQPLVDEMRRRGTPFVGLVYAGLALTAKGLRVVEFNARFGDPETQSVLAMLESPLSELLYPAATGTLADAPAPRWRDGASVTVVLAATGYPGTPRSDDVITGIDAAEQLGTVVNQAGTKQNAEGAVVTSGGRVLAVTAVADSLGAARGKAYEGVAAITFDGAQHRTDIAAEAAKTAA
ncbi:phosphoribosylamine/glycine ligase [Catenulispora acidiphila DSM 44928]|uniref:Phosphoribosylamine--glycine ligase n=1 Tax=Catenulispora acidiphila (strain DSM 44928 / JCM 14897 / NBRC 102108 / NRRL B-24433 / ID139908) TaxID=479433 RepID=C7QJ90_CATAD|nr:phosphoribosylamine--glycine ligase [Catenulispora acidiphila]ACU69232.1 phosphoribosylamine/glycine ligase [Catenulispora acidiphila DSM 44928]